MTDRKRICHRRGNNVARRPRPAEGLKLIPGRRSSSRPAPLHRRADHRAHQAETDKRGCEDVEALVQSIVDGVNRDDSRSSKSSASRSYARLFRRGGRRHTDVKLRAAPSCRSTSRTRSAALRNLKAPRRPTWSMRTSFAEARVFTTSPVWRDGLNPPPIDTRRRPSRSKKTNRRAAVRLPDRRAVVELRRRAICAGARRRPAERRTSRARSNRPTRLDRPRRRACRGSSWRSRRLRRGTAGPQTALRRTRRRRRRSPAAESATACFATTSSAWSRCVPCSDTRLARLLRGLEVRDLALDRIRRAAGAPPGATRSPASPRRAGRRSSSGAPAPSSGRPLAPITSA